MIKAGIIGATGYAGNELARLLLGHKEVEVAWYGSRSYIDQKYADVYQNFFKLIDAKCMEDVYKRQCENHSGKLDISEVQCDSGKTDDENNRGQREITGFAVIHLIINQHTQTGSSDHTIQQE